MFAGMINHLPGQELRVFEIYRSGQHITAGGRVTANSETKLGEIKAILAAARPDEVNRWKQLEHPVSHKIIQQGVAPFQIKPGDYFVRGEKRYINRTDPYNPGDINHWTIYYCDERSDT